MGRRRVQWPPFAGRMGAEAVEEGTGVAGGDDRDRYTRGASSVYRYRLLLSCFASHVDRRRSGFWSWFTSSPLTRTAQRTQEITAIFLVARLVVGCASEMEHDIHIMLDSVSLMSTLWVIYMMRFKLQSTHIKELDNMPIYYLVVPCFVLALFINPALNKSSFPSTISVLWAFCSYLESVSVLPNLRFIQNAKMVEPFTAPSAWLDYLGLLIGHPLAQKLVILPSLSSIQIYESDGKSLSGS